jgi:ornithine cyclodeaminase
VWGRDPTHADRCVDDLRARHDADVTRADSVRAAVEGADIVITCTAAREPLVERAWLAPGAHVTALGSDGAGKQELDPAILEDADLLVVDSRDQCARLGELQHAPAEAGHAIELGAICAGEARGRASDDQLTVCDLTGLGVQDVAAANVVMANAPATAGDRIEL